MSRLGVPVLKVENIPAELRALDRWVVWGYEEKKDGTRTKVPRSPSTSRRASSTNPEDWVSFEEALNFMRVSDAEGIGFVFAGDGYVGVDLDDCFLHVPGRVRAEEAAWVTALNSYTEVSPSGKGLKVIFRGTLPEGLERHSWGGNGIYDWGRFFTITGDVLGSLDHIEDVSPDTLAPLLAEWFPPVERQEYEEVPERLTDAEVLAHAHRAANAEKFRDLHNMGEWEQWYPSHSDADLGLVAMLAFYTGPCPAQLDRMFRASAMFREKWDERRAGTTYGNLTIGKALSFRQEYYEMAPRGNGETTVAAHQERHKRWTRLIGDYAPLGAEERPHILRMVYDHVAPLAERLGDDWVDIIGLSFLSALFGGVKVEGRPLGLWALGISTQGTGKSATSDELESVVRGVASLDAAALSTFTGGSEAGLVRLLGGAANSRSLAYLSEWSGFAKLLDAEHSSRLRELLLNTWDGRGYDHVLATELIRIREPFLVVTGLTTPSAWKKVATYEDTGNGFYSRFIFVCPDVRPAASDEYPYRTRLQRERLVTAVYNHLHRLPPVEQATLDLKPSPAYRAYSEFLGMTRTTETIDLDEVGFNTEDTRASLPGQRLLERVKRMSTVLELLEEVPQVRGTMLRVREANVEKAVRLTQRGAAYAQRAYGWLSRSKDDEQATLVRQALERQPDTVYGLVTRTGLSAVDTSRALDLLSSEGIVASRIEGARRVYEMNGGH